MAVAEAERDERLEERAKALGHVPNYCPFGCTTENLDEYGYCSHLAGFTNDGKTVETIQVRYRKVKDPVTGEVTEEDTQLRFVSGNKKKGHLDTVRAGDKLVNPERMQKGASGIMELARLWVSARVYRREPAKKEKAA